MQEGFGGVKCDAMAQRGKTAGYSKQTWDGAGVCSQGGQEAHSIQQWTCSRGTGTLDELDTSKPEW